MKRSKLLRPVTLGLIGAGAFALSACQEDPAEEVNIFKSAQECMALPGATAESCESGYQEALAEHQKTAPRYDTLEYCEEQHGVGNCGTEVQPQSGGGGSIFMPLLMGYMMGRMLGGGGFASKPLYPTPSGGMTTADKSASFGSGAKSGKVSAGALAPSKPTLGAAPMSKATAASRGGFGSSGARSSGGSLGG